jgi:hypothetical protein
MAMLRIVLLGPHKLLAQVIKMPEAFEGETTPSKLKGCSRVWSSSNHQFTSPFGLPVG